MSTNPFTGLVQEAPKSDPSTPTAEAPKRGGNPIAPGRTVLSNEEVESLRNDYKARRDAARDATRSEEWETSTETEAVLADKYGVSVPTVHRIILGLTYSHVPGPIDRTRRARYETYAAEVKIFGKEIARSRSREVDPPPYCVAVTIRREGMEPSTTYYPAGTSVAVESVKGEVADFRPTAATKRKPSSD